MGKEKKYTIQILNLDTGTKAKHDLEGQFKDEAEAKLQYDQILEILESYNPEIDFDNLVVYYYTRSKWMILLEEQISFDEHQLEWQDKDSDQIQLKLKYHCFYLLDEEEEKRFTDDVKTMNQKITEVSQLYQDLKEKYKQQALDINIFWGSPMVAADDLKRNKKQIEYVTNLQGQSMQLLVNQVKYAPYINAVTTALETCDKSKVQLGLNLLNQKSFNQRNIFTVVYLIAHLQIEEVKDSHKSSTFRKPHHKQKQKPKKQTKPKYVQKKESKQMGRQQEKPLLKKIESEPLKLDNQETPALHKQRSLQSSSLQFEMIIEQEQIKEVPTLLKTTISERQEIQQFLKDAEQTTANQIDLIKQQSRIEITLKQQQQEKAKEDNPDIIYLQDNKKRKRGYKYYFLGEDVNGKLIKIPPKKLRAIIEGKTKRNIQLLILHSSYPYHHLKQIRHLANNIILINSNPLVPEPSSLYFIKQFFIHLLKTGNIEQTYQKSIVDLNKLKQVTTSPKHSLYKQFDEKDIKYISSINQKYVHGSMQCCCCYHEHHEKCHNRKNTSPSKYAEYHYMFHASQCGCLPQNLMIHTCESKKTLLSQQYGVIDAQNYYDKEMYYCCCMGTDLGFYQSSTKNTHIEQIVGMNEEKDPHSIKFKYKHQKMMINEEDNQLQINQGKITGDWNQQLINAFKYIEDNPLLGNARIIVKLFQLFTQQLDHTSLDIITVCQNQMYILCNIYGQKSTGRKTIATYFANLLLIKKLCKRIVIKPFHNVSSIRTIIQNAISEGEGRPFFILIHQDKSSRLLQNHLQLNQEHFGQKVSAIIITDHPVQFVESSITNVKMDFIKPIPFNNDNCQHYIKKYKHLTYEAKNNVKVLFSCANKGYRRDQPFQIFPFSLNQFQVLSLLKKTTFVNYRHFTQGLDRLHKDFIEYYIFIMYTIKFTNSPDFQKQINLAQIQEKLNSIKQQRILFFRKFDETLKEKNEQGIKSISTAQIKRYYDELVSLQQLKDNFYLIFTSVGHKMIKKLPIIMKMFINYTTVLESHKFHQDHTIKKAINYFRIKQIPFSNQLYEATTVNPSSYINRYFSQDLRDIYTTYAQKHQKERQQMYDLQSFIQFHASLFVTRKITKRLSYETYSKPKDKVKLQHDSSSLDHKDRPSIYVSQSFEEREDSKDIPHVYHLASIMEGGLQFARNILCNHFIYNRLSQNQKISLLKHSLFLINNCIVLLKNKKFYDISEQFDLDKSQSDPSFITQNFFFSTHSSSHIDSPNLKSKKSEQFEMPPPATSRTYSGKDVFYPNRQFAFQQSAGKSNITNPQDEKQSATPTDELLLKQLYRLCTFKGVLFLLDEIQRRSQEFTCQDIVRIKICTQLLAIQIRLEQLQIEKQQTKVVLPSNPDRHLNRIAQVFNQKNHNISILYHILRNQINEGRFNRDIEQLGLIKSHIIVSLSLTASRYGKFKIAKAKSMIREIDSFLSEWNAIPFQRRESQQSDGRNNKKQEFLKVQDLPSEYGLLKMICQNEYVYIHILESFTSQKFWARGPKINEEIETYKDLLYIYHHFTLKNTKTKGDYYAKLQAFIDKLHELKKQWQRGSTYIHNFLQSFIKAVQNEFKKLKSSLIAVFNAEDGRYYIKKSLHQQLETILNHNNNQKQFFSIKKKFNSTSLNQLYQNCGCKYLCIFTSIGQNNSKEEILIETNEGKSVIMNKQKIAESISLISSSVLFICLARKKMLAESIINANRFRRSIIYFDFQISNFQEFKDSSEYNAVNENIVIFQKMIMIETVRELLDQIIQKEKEGEKTIYKAFSTCKNSLCFALKSKDGKPILKLSNQQFRKCIFLEEQIYSYQMLVPLKEIQLFTSEKVSKKQIQQLQKIIKKINSHQLKPNQKKKNEQFKIDSFYNIYHFSSVFSFYFRDKFAFDNIFDINFQVWKQEAKDVKSNIIVKKFLEKLTQQKILDFIFSNKNGAIIMYFEPQCYDLYNAALKSCESELKNIISNMDHMQNKRTIIKFIGYTKNTAHIFVYILQCQANSEQV